MADSRDSEKDPNAFRTISEVAEELNLPQHVLRFWETRFAQIKPVKRAGGRRFYRPEDVDLLRGIRQLLYSEGYTIKGVQKILKDQGIRHVQDIGVERDVAVMRSAAPSDGTTFGGLLGLLPRRKAKAHEEPLVGGRAGNVELPLPFPDAEADRDLEEDRSMPVAPLLHGEARERRLEERRYDDAGRYEERIYQERHVQERHVKERPVQERQVSERQMSERQVSERHGQPRRAAAPAREHREPFFEAEAARQLDAFPADADGDAYETEAWGETRYGAQDEAWEPVRQPAGGRSGPPAAPQGRSGAAQRAAEQNAYAPRRRAAEPMADDERYDDDAAEGDGPARGRAPERARRAEERRDPSFAPPEPQRAPRTEALMQRRPTRGPAARVATIPLAEEAEDPLLPFMEHEVPAAEPLEDRIRRLKEREPGPPEEYLPPKLRHRNPEPVPERRAPPPPRDDVPAPGTYWPELARAEEEAPPPRPRAAASRQPLRRAAPEDWDAPEDFAAEQGDAYRREALPADDDGEWDDWSEEDAAMDAPQQLAPEAWEPAPAAEPVRRAAPSARTHAADWDAEDIEAAAAYARPSAPATPVSPRQQPARPAAVAPHSAPAALQATTGSVAIGPAVMPRVAEPQAEEPIDMPPLPVRGSYGQGAQGYGGQGYGGQAYGGQAAGGLGQSVPGQGTPGRGMPEAGGDQQDAYGREVYGHDAGAGRPVAGSPAAYGTPGNMAPHWQEMPAVADYRMPPERAPISPAAAGRPMAQPPQGGVQHGGIAQSGPTAPFATPPRPAGAPAGGGPVAPQQAAPAMAPQAMPQPAAPVRVGPLTGPMEEEPYGTGAGLPPAGTAPWTAPSGVPIDSRLQGPMPTPGMPLPLPGASYGGPGGSYLGGGAWPIRDPYQASAAGRGMPAMQPMPMVQPVLSRDDVNRLQAALYELGECRRLMHEVVEPGAEVPQGAAGKAG